MVNPGTTGLVGYFALNEVSGDAVDSHGGNNFVETNGAIASVAGLVGNARDFEKDNNRYFLGGNVAALKLTDAVTFNFWVNPELAGLQAPIFWNQSAGKGLSVWFSATMKAYLSINGNARATGTTTIPTAEWSMITTTYNKDAGGTTEAKVYVNGALDAEGDYSTAVVYDATASFRIGRDLNGSYDYDGLMQHFSVWSVALSADNCEWLYNTGSGRAYASLSGIPKIKTINGITMAQTKTISGISVASIKSVQGIS